MQTTATSLLADPQQAKSKGGDRVVNSARGENEIRGRVKNLGLKVFMDARQPVTLEEGDRYPLGPPSFVVVSARESHAI